MAEQESTHKHEIGQLGFAASTLNGVIGGGLFVLPAIAAAKVGLLSTWLFQRCVTLITSVFGIDEPCFNASLAHSTHVD